MSALSSLLRQRAKLSGSFRYGVRRFCEIDCDFALPIKNRHRRSWVGTIANNQYFRAFDNIVARHGLEKLQVVGDAYLAVADVPAANRRHPIDTCLAALEMHATRSA